MDRRRSSKCDVAARRRLTIQRADTELFDTTPYRIENKFPLLHARTRDLDDLLLQEIYVLMFRACEVSVTPFSEWVSVPQLVSLFHVSVLPSPIVPALGENVRGGGNGSGSPPLNHAGGGSPPTSSSHASSPKSDGPQLVGGMLFANGEFLFGEMPFVRNRVKDVRCRLEFDGMDKGLAWLATVPQPPQKPPPKATTSRSFDEDPNVAVSVDGPALDDDAPGVAAASTTSSASGPAITIGIHPPPLQPGSKRHSMENPLGMTPNREASMVTSPTVALPLLMPSVAEANSVSGNVSHRGSISSSLTAYPATNTKAMFGGIRLPANVNVASNGIATCRVHFRVEEFECGAMSWIVQRFQLIEPNNNITYGPVFARAFQPADAVLTSSASAGHYGNRVRRIAGGIPPIASDGEPGGDSSPASGGGLLDGGSILGANLSATSTTATSESFAASQFGVGVDEMHRAKRKALPGEERLRVLKPALYQWCLDRSPTEMGAGATIIKELLLYFRHTFSVVRTIRSLMQSVRRIQTACRRMLERRRNATVKMLTEWTRLELDVQGQLSSYVPVSNDPVDAAVYEALKANIITGDEFKLSVITQMYSARQEERLLLPPEKRGDELLAARYRFYIAPQDLLAESHRRLVERLCRTADSPIFRDARIREILKDRTEEILKTRAKMEKQELRRKEAARHKGTFGTANRLMLSPRGPQTRNDNIKSLTSQRNSPTSRSDLNSSRLSGGGGMMTMIPSPPPGAQGRRNSVTFSMRSGDGTGVRRRGGGRGKGATRGPRPQHLSVLDAMFDDV